MFFPTWGSTQVSMVFDQETKGIVFSEKNWKSGEMLKIKIDNHGCNDLKYVIVYSSTERINAQGVALFNTISTTPIKKAGYSTSSYTYLEIPIEAKDYSHITISEYKGTTKTDEVVYTYSVKGGLKFDVSTGFFVTGLKDDNYILVNYTDSTKTIIAENSGEFRVGAGVLAHLHSRWGGPVNLGIAGGFEINNEAKIGYLAGGSVFFGYDQKFVLSAGIALGKRQVLSKAYKPGQVVNNAISIVPMVGEWKESWFLSLTYNF